MALLLLYDWKCVSLYISTACLLVACQKRSQVCKQHTFPIIPSSGSIRMTSHNAVFPGRRACVWVKRMSSRWRTRSSGPYRERSDRNWELLSWPTWVFLLDRVSLINSLIIESLNSMIIRVRAKWASALHIPKLRRTAISCEWVNDSLIIFLVLH